MARKKPAALPAERDTPLNRLADEFGVPADAVQVVADVWGCHLRHEHVDGDLLIAYVQACGRLVSEDGKPVADAVVERVKAMVKPRAADV